MLGLSFNQPKFCSNATWSTNAVTFANISIVGSNPWAIFIDTNNTLYGISTAFNQVLIWNEGSAIPTRNISNGLNSSSGLFVASNGDIYVDNGDVYHRVDKWTVNGTNSAFVMNVTTRCFDLFIDMNNTIYCSMDFESKVVEMSLNTGSKHSDSYRGQWYSRIRTIHALVA